MITASAPRPAKPGQKGKFDSVPALRKAWNRVLIGDLSSLQVTLVQAPLRVLYLLTNVHRFVSNRHRLDAVDPAQMLNQDLACIRSITKRWQQPVVRHILERDRTKRSRELFHIPNLIVVDGFSSSQRPDISWRVHREGMATNLRHREKVDVDVGLSGKLFPLSSGCETFGGSNRRYGKHCLRPSGPDLRLHARSIKRHCAVHRISHVHPLSLVEAQA